MKVGASHTPSQTLLPLTSRSPRTHRWVHSHSPTVSCAYRAAVWRQPLPTCSPSMPSSARAAAPACRRAAALEVRFRAAAGVGEEAHSWQPHWRPWSKPMNVETCGHVADLIVMAHAFAELRDGVVARQHEHGFKCKVGTISLKPRNTLGRHGSITVKYCTYLKGLSMGLSEIVPIFETAFVLACYYAISKLCQGMCHHHGAPGTCPHVSTFTGFDHGHQCRCRECASSPTPTAAG